MGAIRLHGPLARWADVEDPRPCGWLWPADRTYDSNFLRENLGVCGAWANLRTIANRMNPTAFRPFLYRNLIERFFNKLKHFRSGGTRFGKLPENYLASVELASNQISMQFNWSVT
jgi:hypothetical protein